MLGGISFLLGRSGWDETVIVASYEPCHEDEKYVKPMVLGDLFDVNFQVC